MALSKIPAFGYENYLCFSKEHVDVALHKTKTTAEDIEMARMAVIPSDTWGLSAPIKQPASLVASETKHRFTYINNSKILGYFPVLGVVPGITHLFSGIADKKYSAAFIARGILEILGLGFLLVIPDLITNAIRMKQAKKDLKEVNWRLDFKKKVSEHIKEIFKEKMRHPAPSATAPSAPIITPAPIPKPTPPAQPLAESHTEAIKAFVSSMQEFEQLPPVPKTKKELLHDFLNIHKNAIDDLIQQNNIALYPLKALDLCDGFKAVGLSKNFLDYTGYTADEFDKFRGEFSKIVTENADIKQAVNSQVQHILFKEHQKHNLDLQEALTKQLLNQIQLRVNICFYMQTQENRADLLKLKIEKYEPVAADAVAKLCDKMRTDPPPPEQGGFWDTVTPYIPSVAAPYLGVNTNSTNP